MALRVAMAQISPWVGDIDGNVERVLEAWRKAHAQGADLVVFTELTITGYPPEDLLLKEHFVQANTEALDRLATEGPEGTVAVVGCVGDEGHAEPDEDQWDVTVSARDLRNRAAVLADGEIVATYDKGRLPNYGVFDEARYFVSAEEPCVVEVAGVPVGITVCEDLWTRGGPIGAASEAGAKVLVNVNASPFHEGKRRDREKWVRHHATEEGLWVVYVNQVGGQDDVVFDGDSMLCAPDGEVVARGKQFDTDFVVADLDVDLAAGTAPRAAASVGGFRGERPQLDPPPNPPELDPLDEVWNAVVLGTRDYARKNGFETMVLGLSGGIDSTVAACVAAEAIGGENVRCVAMPSPYTSDASNEDARALAENLGMRFDMISIEPGMDAFDDMLTEAFEGTERGVAEENIQARLRGMILMALSNKFGSLLIATGNKSEMAVGYATLYGDMAGGFAPLKDVLKTRVYDLADRFNERNHGAIPQRVIEREPTAELKPGQKDEDALPSYEVLDRIIEGYVEQAVSIEDLVAEGLDRAVVEKAIRLIDGAEFKRRQGPPGVKITDRAFGKDRRVPITTAWRG